MPNYRYYCKGFVKNNLQCILCMQEASFKARRCYEKVEHKK